MNRITKSAMAFVAALTGLSIGGSASADGPLDFAFVSTTGDDENDCSRSAPCRTVATASANTANGGVISVLDPGDFGIYEHESGVRTIDGALAQGAVRILILTKDGSLTLRNLELGNQAGRIVNQMGGALHVENSVIRNSTHYHVENSVIRNSTHYEDLDGYGIWMSNIYGSAQLFVSNSTIAGNGSGSNGGGIQIGAWTEAPLKVVVSGSIIDRNTVGIRADARTGSGPIDVQISNTRISGSAYHGVVALGGSGTPRIAITRSVIAHNAQQGIRANGANAKVTLDQTSVFYNGVGVFAGAGGVVQSFGTNAIAKNVTAGAPPTPISLQ